MSHPDELLPLYLDSDATRIRLIGGPNNGRVITWSTGTPPPRIETAVPESISAYLAEPIKLSFRKAAYRPMLDDVGLPSRTDDGVLLYECYGE